MHAAGPMLQGRDGIGAAPCCGTGVVFRRDVGRQLVGKHMARSLRWGKVGCSCELQRGMLLVFRAYI